VIFDFWLLYWFCNEFIELVWYLFVVILLIL